MQRQFSAPRFSPLTAQHWSFAIGRPETPNMMRFFRDVTFPIVVIIIIIRDEREKSSAWKLYLTFIAPILIFAS